jgi:hypothetical protein
MIVVINSYIESRKVRKWDEKGYNQVKKLYNIPEIKEVFTYSTE